MKALNAALNLALAVAITAPIALPVKAEETKTTTTTSMSKTVSTSVQTNQLQTNPGQTNQAQTNQVVIPQNSGVIIKLPMDITIDVGQKQDYPLTVPLMQPLYDDQGNEIVPVNTPVVIKLKPENGGARIVAESIVFRGRVVAINAAAGVVPGQTIEQVSGAQKAQQNGAVFGNMFGSILGAVAPESKKADMFDQGALIGGAVGILSGITSPKNVRIVQLPGDSVHVLMLQSSIVLPAFAQ
jgi:hypothetical protein